LIPMIFSEVRVTGVADTPVLLLREARGDRYLPVWISAAGANAILSALEDAPDEHPASHDLIVALLAALGAVVDEVRIIDVVEGVFTAQMRVGEATVACRVSDGVAVALRCAAAISVSESVLDRAGTLVRPGDPGEGSDAQMEQFRAFLDTLRPEDFDPGAGEGPQP
jgi:bifunctional DNase/RNase